MKNPRRKKKQLPGLFVMQLVFHHLWRYGRNAKALGTSPNLAKAWPKTEHAMDLSTKYRMDGKKNDGNGTDFFF